VAEGVATNGKPTVVYASFGFGCSGKPRFRKNQGGKADD